MAYETNSIGGVGTLVGTPPNAIVVGQLRELPLVIGIVARQDVLRAVRDLRAESKR